MFCCWPGQIIRSPRNNRLSVRGRVSRHYCCPVHTLRVVSLLSHVRLSPPCYATFLFAPRALRWDTERGAAPREGGEGTSTERVGHAYSGGEGHATANCLGAVPRPRGSVCRFRCFFLRLTNRHIHFPAPLHLATLPTSDGQFHTTHQCHVGTAGLQHPESSLETKNIAK